MWSDTKTIAPEGQKWFRSDISQRHHILCPGEEDKSWPMVLCQSMSIPGDHIPRPVEGRVCPECVRLHLEKSEL